MSFKIKICNMTEGDRVNRLTNELLSIINGAIENCDNTTLAETIKDEKSWLCNDIRAVIKHHIGICFEGIEKALIKDRIVVDL